MPHSGVLRVNTANSNGNVQASMLTSSGYGTFYVPATGIKVVVGQSSPSRVPSASVACMLNNRFRVALRYRGAFDNNSVDTDASVKPVVGFASYSYETAFFYFNNANNIEMMVKLLDQGNVNAGGQPTIALLYGSATPLRIELTVTDTQSGATKQYTSEFGSQAGQTDFTAFVK